MICQPVLAAASAVPHDDVVDPSILLQVEDQMGVRVVHERVTDAVVVAVDAP